MILAEITKDTFDDQVLKAGQPVLVDFYSPTCGFCKKLAPVLEQLADELHDQLQIVKLDATAAKGLAKTYDLMGLPTIALFKNGEKVGQWAGLRPKEEIMAKVMPLL